MSRASDRRTSVLRGALLAALLIVPSAVAGQDPAALQQQQIQRMQEHVRQLNETMQRMAGVQERAHQMEQQILRDMERLRVQRDMDVQMAERLRQEERLREMAHSVNVGAQEMHRAMEQLRNMLDPSGAPFRGDLEPEVERLRAHWEAMAGSMEEGLRLLERLRDRVQASAPQG
jgi:signal recognition particle GTPase